MSDVRLPSDWCTRLIIGGLGGLTLVIVRASQLRFYIGAPDTTALVGWLTLLGLAIVSMIWALMTDDGTRMKVYVAGLGAPSLVVAFVSGSLQFSATVEAEPTNDSSRVPQLSLFLPALYAETQLAAGAAETATQDGLSVEELDFREMDSGSIADGFRASIVGQRPPDRNQYLYVIGRTTEEVTAKRTARQLIAAMDQAYQDGLRPDVHLLKDVGNDEIYVSVGGLRPTLLEAETLRANVMSVFLGSNVEADTKNLIRKGVIVDARGLAGER